MSHANLILLLGAGFSRNWGGWLASEVFEYLLGCEEVDDALRTVLLQHRDRGFEAALDFLQGEELKSGISDPRLANLKKALGSVFRAMNEGLSGAAHNQRVPHRHWTDRLPYRTRMHQT